MTNLEEQLHETIDSPQVRNTAVEENEGEKTTELLRFNRQMIESLLIIYWCDFMGSFTSSSSSAASRRSERLMGRLSEIHTGVTRCKQKRERSKKNRHRLAMNLEGLLGPPIEVPHKTLTYRHPPTSSI